MRAQRRKGDNFNVSRIKTANTTRRVIRRADKYREIAPLLLARSS